MHVPVADPKIELAHFGIVHAGADVGIGGVENCGPLWVLGQFAEMRVGRKRTWGEQESSGDGAGELGDRGVSLRRLLGHGLRETIAGLGAGNAKLLSFAQLLLALGKTAQANERYTNTKAR